MRSRISLVPWYKVAQSSPPGYDVFHFAVAGLAIASIVPVLIVDMPAMVDYPNHLARMYVLAMVDTPAANPFYEVTWRLYPNLAMDLIVPTLAKFMSVETAAKSFLLLSQILIVSGAVALEWAVKRKVQISGLAALLALYSMPFAWGFLNFQFALGLALWALAAMVLLRTSAWPIRALVHTTFVVALFLSHLFALGLYAAALGLGELSRLWPNLRSMAFNLVLIAAPVAVLLAIMHATQGAVGNGATEWDILSKFRSVFRVLNGYSVAFASASAAALIVAIYVLFRSGAASLSNEGRWIAGGFALLFLLMPYRLVGTAYVDVRVLVAALLIVPAYVSLSRPINITHYAAALLVVLIIIGNVAITSAVWTMYQADYARLKASLNLLDGSARVLVGRAGNGEEDLLELPMHHAPTLAVTTGAFVPTLYALPGMQPIRIREIGRHLAISDIIYNSPVPLNLLMKFKSGTEDQRVPRFVRRWPKEFDYLFLVGPRVANPSPDLLQQLAAGERFALYRIRHANDPASAKQNFMHPARDTGVTQRTEPGQIELNAPVNLRAS